MATFTFVLARRLDGTFKTAPNIFVQLFTILGLRHRAGRPNEEVALPLVYALLSSKAQALYKEVLQAVRDVVTQFNIADCVPSRIITNFELGIINACKGVYPSVPTSCCYFHLSQSIYRRVQEAGVQVAYNDRDDWRIKEITHMMLSLAFIPIDDVNRVFDLLQAAVPTTFKCVVDYFNHTYVKGRASRKARTKPATGTMGTSSVSAAPVEPV